MSDQISRRQFLIAGATIAGSAVVMGGLPELLDKLTTAAPKYDSLLLTAAQESVIPSICFLCSSGCGVLARVADGRVVKLEGNPLHPINAGALCPKGQAAPELLYNPDRLAGPLRRVGKRGAGEWESITWSEAIDLVAEKLQAVRATGHPERAACLYGETRGQMRPFIERFMQAVGSPNAISHDSLNIEAARLAMYLTQGIYDLPAYDLENSNYVLSFGANLLEAGRCRNAWS
jgi:anaerobic selenocysteine-containing dehydrogenase